MVPRVAYHSPWPRLLIAVVSLIASLCAVSGGSEVQTSALALPDPVRVTACARTSDATYCAALGDAKVLKLIGDGDAADIITLPYDRYADASWCGATLADDAVYCIAPRGMITSIVRITANDRAEVLPNVLCFGCSFSRACAFTRDALLCAPHAGTQALRVDMEPFRAALFELPQHDSEYAANCGVGASGNHIVCVASGKTPRVLRLGPSTQSNVYAPPTLVHGSVFAVACTARGSSLVCALRGSTSVLSVDEIDASGTPTVRLIDVGNHANYTPSSFLARPFTTCRSTRDQHATLCMPGEAPFAVYLDAHSTPHHMPARGDVDHRCSPIRATALACVSSDTPAHITTFSSTSPFAVERAVVPADFAHATMRTSVCENLATAIVCFTRHNARSALVIRVEAPEAPPPRPLHAAAVVTPAPRVPNPPALPQPSPPKPVALQPEAPVPPPSQPNPNAAPPQPASAVPPVPAPNGVFSDIMTEVPHPPHHKYARAIALEQMRSKHYD